MEKATQSSRDTWFLYRGFNLAGGSIWLFKSTYYDEFRRKILTILSLPANSFFDVEYDNKWVDKELERVSLDSSMFQGLSAYFVFYDYASSPPRFLPIRLCKVDSIQFGVRCRIRLQVGRFLSLRDGKKDGDFSQAILSSLKKRDLIDETGRPLKLVLLSKDDSLATCVQEVEVDEDKTWQEIVEHLVGTQPIKRYRGTVEETRPQFDRSLFYRVQVIDDETFNSLALRESRIELQPNKNYLIRLGAYQPHCDKFKSGEAAKLRFALDDGHFQHVGPHSLKMPLAHRVYTKDFEIRVRPILQGGESHIAIEATEDEYSSPSCSIRYWIPRRLGGILLRVLLFGVGLAMASQSEAISTWLVKANIPLSPLAVTIVGVLLSAVLLYRIQSGQL
jgi:hypothetical protein